jgi:hypothetical protein
MTIHHQSYAIKKYQTSANFGNRLKSTQKMCRMPEPDAGRGSEEVTPLAVRRYVYTPKFFI